MKKSRLIEQQLSVLRAQLTLAKKHERRASERQFLKLAKSIGIYGLPADQLAREFSSSAKAQHIDATASVNTYAGDEL